MPGDYERRVLDNGLCVIGVRNPALHYVVCDVRVHAGYRFETPQQTGLTHFLEHMIHQGSRSFPSSSALLRAVEDLGGVIDASTGPESLDVSLGVHRRHWRKGLAILTDILLGPLFQPEEVEKEKKIVAQEIAEYRGERHRNISASELAYGLLFQEGFSELGVRGSLALLQRFDRTPLQEHYERFFIPENMVVSVAGAFEFEDVLAELAASLGRMPAGRPLPPLVQRPLTRRRRRAVYRMTQRLPVVEIEMACHAYGLGDPRFDAIQAATHILGGGLSSRLFIEVREERGLVYHIASMADGYSDTGSLNTVLNVEAESLLDAVSATLEVIARTAGEGVTAEELERYKESVRCGMEIMCDRPQGLADWFGRQELLLRPEQLLTPEAYVARHEALTEPKLLEVLGDVLADDSANLSVVGPFTEQQADSLRKLFPAEEVGRDAPGSADR